MRLGDALKAAGVPVREDRKPTMTLAEAHQLALRARGGREETLEHHSRALEGLPTEFEVLRSSRKGEDFVRELQSILRDRREVEVRRGRPGFEINRHTVFGLSQLVHERRDALQGSRRKSFDRLIPKFLEMKKELEKDPSKKALEVLEKHLR